MAGDRTLFLSLQLFYKILFEACPICEQTKDGTAIPKGLYHLFQRDFFLKKLLKQIYIQPRRSLHHTLIFGNSPLQRKFQGQLGGLVTKHDRIESRFDLVMKDLF